MSAAADKKNSELPKPCQRTEQWESVSSVALAAPQHPSDCPALTAEQAGLGVPNSHYMPGVAKPVICRSKRALAPSACGSPLRRNMKRVRCELWQSADGRCAMVLLGCRNTHVRLST